MKPFVRVGVPVVLATLTAIGLWLVFTGGADTGDSTGPGDTSTVDTGSGDTGSGDTGSGDTGSGDTGSGDTGRLPIDGTDMESVSELAGLELPASTDGFRTARLDDDSQLDVSFTIAPGDEAAFITDSGLPEPRDDQRVITHASPLWEMNVDAPIRAAADTTGGVTRAVELVDENGRTRVRMVITPAG